jgi:hypothetical protein
MIEEKMQEHIIAENKIIEITFPLEISNQIKLDCIAQFEDFINNAKNQFRTPLNIDNPQPGAGYQWQAHSTPAIDQFKNNITVIANEIFAESYEIQDAWFLLQPFEPWVNNPEHQHMTADMIVTLYVNVIEGESSIEFYQNNLQSSEKFYPKNGSVLIAPGNVIHKPNPNTSNYQRISLNLQLGKKQITNNPTASTYDQRMDICNGCPRLNALKFCMECSCFMPFKTKMNSAKCPLEKW